jgi:hypothetical protein
MFTYIHLNTAIAEAVTVTYPRTLRVNIGRYWLLILPHTADPASQINEHSGQAREGGWTATSFKWMRLRSMTEKFRDAKKRAVLSMMFSLRE